MKIRLVKKVSDEVKNQISEKNIIIANDEIKKQRKKTKNKFKKTEIENIKYELNKLEFYIKESKIWNKVLYVKCGEKEYYWEAWFYFLLQKATRLNTLALRMKSFTDLKYENNDTIL